MATLGIGQASFLCGSALFRPSVRSAPRPSRAPLCRASLERSNGQHVKKLVGGAAAAVILLLQAPQANALQVVEPGAADVKSLGGQYDQASRLESQLDNAVTVLKEAVSSEADPQVAFAADVLGVAGPPLLAQISASSTSSPDLLTSIQAYAANNPALTAGLALFVAGGLTLGAVLGREEVDADAALRALGEKGAALLDIRSKAELARSGSPSLKSVGVRAVRIPATVEERDGTIVEVPDFIETVNNASRLRAGGPVLVVMDKSGEASRKVAKQLRGGAFAKVLVVKGGADAWKESGWRKTMSKLDLESVKEAIFMMEPGTIIGGTLGLALAATASLVIFSDRAQQEYDATAAKVTSATKSAGAALPDISALPRLLSAPSPEMKAPALESKSPSQGLKAPSSELKAPMPAPKAPSPELKAPSSELKGSASESKASLPEVKASPPEGKAKAPSPEVKAKAPSSEPKAEVKAPLPEAKAPSPEGKAEAKAPEVKTPPPEVKAKAPQPEPKAEVKAPLPEAKAPEVKTPSPEAKVPSPEAKAPSPEVKAPAPEAKAPSPEAKAPSPEVKAPAPEAKAPSPEAKAPSKPSQSEVKAPSPEAKAPSSDTKAPLPEAKASSSETKASLPEVKAPSSEAKAPTSEAKASSSEAKAPLSEAKAQSPETKASSSDTKAPSSDAKTPAPEVKAPSSETKAPKPEVKTPPPEVKAPSADVKTPLPELKAPSQEAKGPSPEAKAPSSEAKASSPDAKASSPDAKGPAPEVKPPLSKLTSPVPDVKTPPPPELKAPSSELKAPQVQDAPAPDAKGTVKSPQGSSNSQQGASQGPATKDLPAPVAPVQTSKEGNSSQDTETSSKAFDMKDPGMAVTAALVAVWALSFGAIWTYFKGSAEKAEAVTAEEALQALQEEGAALVDIRSRAEIARSGYPSLRSVGVSAVRVPEFVEEKDGTRRSEVADLVKAVKGAKGLEAGGSVLVVLDKSGETAKMVAKQLKGGAFSRVLAVEGGADAWKVSGLAWRRPNTVFTLDLENVKGTLADIGQDPTIVMGTLGLAAAATASLVLFSENGNALKLLGSVAVLQLFARRLLYAEDRKKLLEQIQSYLDTKVAPPELAKDIKELGATLISKDSIRWLSEGNEVVPLHQPQNGQAPPASLLARGRDYGGAKDTAKVPAQKAPAENGARKRQVPDDPIYMVKPDRRQKPGEDGRVEAEEVKGYWDERGKEPVATGPKADKRPAASAAVGEALVRDTETWEEAEAENGYSYYSEDSDEEMEGYYAVQEGDWVFYYLIDEEEEEEEALYAEEEKKKQLAQQGLAKKRKTQQASVRQQLNRRLSQQYRRR